MEKIFVLFFLNNGINNGTIIFLFWFRDHTVIRRGSGGLPNLGLRTPKNPSKKKVWENKSWWKKFLFCFSLRTASIMGPEFFFFDFVTRRSCGEGLVVCQIWVCHHRKIQPKKKSVRKKKLMKIFFLLFSF